MSKTTPLDDKTYDMLKNTQKILFDNYHIRISMKDIIRLIVLAKTPEEMTVNILKTMGKAIEKTGDGVE